MEVGIGGMEEVVEGVVWVVLHDPLLPREVDRNDIDIVHLCKCDGRLCQDQIW